MTWSVWLADNGRDSAQTYETSEEATDAARHIRRAGVVWVACDGERVGRWEDQRWIPFAAPAPVAPPPPAPPVLVVKRRPVPTTPPVLVVRPPEPLANFENRTAGRPGVPEKAHVDDEAERYPLDDLPPLKALPVADERVVQARAVLDEALRTRGALALRARRDGHSLATIAGVLGTSRVDALRMARVGEAAEATQDFENPTDDLSTVPEKVDSDVA